MVAKTFQVACNLHKIWFSVYGIWHHTFHRFGQQHCLHLLGSPRRQNFLPIILENHEDRGRTFFPKRWYLYTNLHGFTFQNTAIISTDVRTSNLVQDVHFQNEATYVSIHSSRSCHVSCATYSWPRPFLHSVTARNSICSGRFATIHNQHACPSRE